MSQAKEDVPEEVPLGLDLPESWVSPANSDTLVRPSPRVHNPLLCGRCQRWDDVWALGNPEWEIPRLSPTYTTFEELLSRPACLVCQALSEVIATRLRRDLDVMASS